MSSSGSVGGPGGAGGERNVLVVGDDFARVERFVPSLRRASCSVRPVLGAPTAMQLVRESAFDLIVVVLPLASAEALLREVRGDASRSGRAAIALVLAPDEPGAEGAESWALGARSNRVLQADCTPEDLLETAGVLLNAAPRVTMNAPARILLARGEAPLAARVEELSSTGLLLSARELPALGSVFAFEIAVASVEAPIRGQAQVVRYAVGRTAGLPAVAATFVSFGGEGGRLLEKVVFQERAAAEAKQWIRPDAAPSAPPRGGPPKSGVIDVRNPEELKWRKEELAELSPLLDSLLQKGLQQRARSAEWYVSAAGLALESLASFSAILDVVYGGGKSEEVATLLSDLERVRRSLAEFALPKQEAAGRVRILLELRPSLERLLRAMALMGAAGEEVRLSAAKPRGIVAQILLEVQRLLRARQLLGRFAGEVEEMEHPRFIVAKGALKQKAGEVRKAYEPFSRELGLDREERLLTRQGRAEAAMAARRELRKLDMWLTGVHRTVYTARFKGRAGPDPAADLEESRLAPVLVETLSAGSDLLVRAYGAYRHALEAAGADPRLLERVAGLAASVASAELRGIGSSTGPAARRDPPPRTPR